MGWGRSSFEEAIDIFSRNEEESPCHIPDISFVIPPTYYQYNTPNTKSNRRAWFPDKMGLLVISPKGPILYEVLIRIIGQLVAHVSMSALLAAPLPGQQTEPNKPKGHAYYLTFVPKLTYFTPEGSSPTYKKHHPITITPVPVNHQPFYGVRRGVSKGVEDGRRPPVLRAGLP
jgi:hypothetical protein